MDRAVDPQHKAVNSRLKQNHDIHLLCDNLYCSGRQLTGKEECDVAVLMENSHNPGRSAVMLLIVSIPGLLYLKFNA